MRYLSVCSGIEAASVAWEPLGWEAAAFSEIEAFPRAVLAHRFPHVPLHGDFTTIRGDEYGPVDVVVGGTPCQSFSVAGLRKGMADPRGNLALGFLGLVDRVRPSWVVWENVPGVLSSNGGRDFGSFLGGLAELGYGWAYRVLDAQYCGVPQRRRRVFVVGYSGDWRRAAAVLFERESMSGHPAPRREAGEGITPTLASRARGGGGLGTDFDCDGGLIAAAVTSKWAKGSGGPAGDECQNLIAPPLTGNPYGDHESREGLLTVAHSLRADGFDTSEDGTGRGTPLVPITLAIRGRGESCDLETRQDGTANAILTPNGGRGGIGVGAVAFDTTQITSKANLSNPKAGDPCHPLAASAMQVRRLTPRECERLQGFPDGWTDVPYRGKSASDGPRYKALGNSFAVPVVRWIGERIQAVEELAASLTSERAA